MVVAGVEIRAKTNRVGRRSRSSSSADFLRCHLAASEPIVPSIIHLVRLTTALCSSNSSLTLAVAAKFFNKKERVEMATIATNLNEANANSIILLRWAVQTHNRSLHQNKIAEKQIKKNRLNLSSVK